MINLILIAFFRRLSDLFHNLANVLLNKTSQRLLFPYITSKNEQMYFRKFQAQTDFIPGMISRDQATTLFHLSLLINVKGDVVEIGSWLGKSTVFLAKGCQISGNGIVHAIDTFQGNPGKEDMYNAPLNFGETIYGRFLQNIKNLKLEKFIKVYKMTSKEASNKVKIKARLIFIDGCHDYEAVKQDIQLWKGFLLKGGYIALDDFNKRFPGSVRAIKEKIIDSNEFKALIITDSLIIAQKNR